MVDVTRQMLANTFITLYNQLLVSWHAGNVTQIQTHGLTLIDLLGDMDSVLSTDQSFILGKWIANAKRWAEGNDSYAAYLEYNARNQITLWGPSGQISDYASKQWGGLIRTYYIPRLAL